MKLNTIAHTVNGLRLELAPGTLALRRLACGPRMWLDNGAAGAHLWQLHAADAAGRIVDLDGAAAKTVAARMDGDTLRLEWRGVRDARSGAGPFDVRVVVAAHATAPNLTAWRLSVKNGSRSWTIWHVLFPRLAGLVPGKAPAADRFFWPEMWGMQETGWDTMTDVSGPCGGYGKHSMQFMGFTRTAGGGDPVPPEGGCAHASGGGRVRGLTDRSGCSTLYLGAHDSEHWQKHMRFTPGKAGDIPRRGAMHFLLHPSGMTEAGNGYEQNYDIMVGELAGDWFDAAAVYAEFARRQSWACEPPARASHGPREAREVLVWEQASINAFPSDRVETVNGKPAAEWARDMIALRRKLGVRIAVHMYHWHQTPFDTNYPDYFPVKRGFRQLVADLKKGGVVVMPYINGRLWDQAAPSYGPEAAAAAEKISAKRVNPRTLYAWPETYGNGQCLTGMCLHTDYWRQTVVNLCRRIVRELDCGGVYLDQLGCFGGRVCLDPRHGHPLGGGTYWLAGMRRMLAEVRDAIGPEPLLTTENNWEGCVADFDALLDTQWNHETNLPIFPAVYGGLGAIYGGDVFGPAYANGGESFVQRMGMRFVWGGQFGWGHLEPLLKEENRALLQYFTTLCRVRAEYARYFCRGEFLRPPELTLKNGTPCSNPLKGPVLASQWSDPDAPGRAAIFLVNVTRTQQALRLRPHCGQECVVTLQPLAARAVLT